MQSTRNSDIDRIYSDIDKTESGGTSSRIDRGQNQQQRASWSCFFQHTDEEINEAKINIVKYFVSGAWALSESDPQWAPSEVAWHCKRCASQFSLFQRKHHCRRCGGVFCAEDSPYVDIVQCLPKPFQEV